MDPALLFIIIFIVAPIIERLLKGKKQAPPPPQQRPRRERPPMPRPRSEEMRTQLPRAEQPDEEARAAEMLPDDLWEILTGQRRERPAPPPQESPVPAGAEQRQPTQPQPGRPRPGIVRKPTRPAEPERVGRMQIPPERRPAPARAEAADDEEAQLSAEAPREVYPVEGYIREIPVHAPPEIVSLEELVIDDEKRHARFHERVSTFKTSQVQRGKRHRISTLLRQSDPVRQAVVMAEVLGKPKGMP